MHRSSTHSGMPLVEGVIWATAAAAGRRPRLGPLHAGVGAGRFGHSEWTALLGRFVADGAVDYPGLKRVQRLVGVYLHRLSEVDPESFIDTDDQLAFYLNAYHSIAIDQVLRAYPIGSLRDVPGAFVRPYPIGRRNVSLATLHATILRGFGDPRVHTALSLLAQGGPQLMPEAFTGGALQGQLAAAHARFLADAGRSVAVSATGAAVVVSPLLAWLGGDFLRPDAMPAPGNLLRGRARLSAVLGTLEPLLSAPVRTALAAGARVQVGCFDWRLNGQLASATAG